MTRYKIINIDRHGTIAHVPVSVEHDRGVVLDHETLHPHPLTKKPQPTTVFRGTIPECNRFVAMKIAAEYIVETMDHIAEEDLEDLFGLSSFTALTEVVMAVVANNGPRRCNECEECSWVGFEGVVEPMACRDFPSDSAVWDDYNLYIDLHD